MKNRRSCQPSLEFLEVRDTPTAGTVTGSFANGTWALVGDAEANTIRINPTANPQQFEVAGLAGTTVAGVVKPSNVQNIVIRLGAGDDILTFNNTATLARLPGKLSIAGGNGANEVNVYDLKMAGLTITNGANTSGEDDVYLVNLIVQNNLTVNNGDGESYTTIEADDDDAFSRIGGNVTVLNGAGNNYTYVTDTFIAGNVTVKNGLPDASNNAGYVEFYNSSRSSRSIVGGNISVSYQGGFATDDELYDIEVFGNVLFNYGSGGGELDVGSYDEYQPVHVHGNFTVLGRSDTQVDIGVYNTLPLELIVDRNFAVVTGAGTDQITIWGLNVRGTTRIATGAGNDTIAIDDSIITGATTLLTGAGLDTVLLERDSYLEHATEFLKSLTVRLGSDNDTLSIGIPNSGSQHVDLLGLAFLDGGAGDDTFNRLNILAGRPISALFETINV